MRRHRIATAYVCALFIAILSVATLASAQAAPDWSGVSPVSVKTTDGPVAETFTLQAARVGDQVFFRVQFNYTGASNPGLVFFAIELGRTANVTNPMSAGDEMMIASQKGPDGKAPTTYDYYLSGDEMQPDPIVPGSVKVETMGVSGSHYEMVFSRPMTTNDTTEQVQLAEGTPVPLAFAVSEWGQESGHAYTWFTYAMNVTQDRVNVYPYEREGSAGQVVVRETMMITPIQALVEGAAIFAVLFVSIMYLGSRRAPERAG